MSLQDRKRSLVGRNSRTGFIAITALAVLVLGALSSGCGGETTEEYLCVPGEQRSCQCSNGNTGYQKCYSGTRYGSCLGCSSDSNNDSNNDNSNNATCIESGNLCNAIGDCCSDSICVDYGSFTSCGYICTDGSECKSGCCYWTDDYSFKVCSPC
jgi:hypothetical protein